MSNGRQPPERVGEVGPVELTSALGPGDDGPERQGPEHERPERQGPEHDRPEHEGPDDTAAGGSAPGALERRMGAWWQSLPPRRRRAGSALVALAVVAALVVPVLDHRTPQPPPPPPNDLTAVQYLGLSTGGGQASDAFTISVRVGDLGTAPLTIHQVTQAYRGVSLSVEPDLPLTARADRPVTLTLRATVHDCAQVTPDDPYPVLILTVSDSTATQTQADSLGDLYILGIHGAVLRACRNQPGFGGPFPQNSSNSGIYPQ